MAFAPTQRHGPISATHHASPQIKAGQKLVRKAHKGNQGTLLPWLLDGADADAIRGLRREVPGGVHHEILVFATGTIDVAGDAKTDSFSFNPRTCTGSDHIDSSVTGRI